MDIINKFRQKQYKFITYSEIDKIPFNEELDFSQNQDKSILCTRLANTKTGASFRVIMQPGTKWEDHAHDCDETILVYKGILKGLITKTVISRGSIIQLPAKTQHEIQSETYSEFYVEFNKPKK